MSKSKTILFYMCGRSGSGKDSILKRLLKSDLSITPIIPTTTRAMRVGEKEGVEYYFQTKEKFFEFEKEGKLLTYLTVNVFDENENPKVDYYGYPKPTNQVSILTGPWDIMMRIMNENPNTDEFELVPIYIMPEHEYELLYRVMKREMRNPKPKIREVARRFCADQEVYPKTKEEAASIIGKDKVIINIDLEEAVQEVNQLIRNTLKKEGILYE